MLTTIQQIRELISGEKNIEKERIMEKEEMTGEDNENKNKKNIRLRQIIKTRMLI